MAFRWPPESLAKRGGVAAAAFAKENFNEITPPRDIHDRPRRRRRPRNRCIEDEDDDEDDYEGKIRLFGAVAYASAARAADDMQHRLDRGGYSFRTGQ